MNECLNQVFVDQLTHRYGSSYLKTEFALRLPNFLANSTISPCSIVATKIFEGFGEARLLWVGTCVNHYLH